LNSLKIKSYTLFFLLLAVLAGRSQTVQNNEYLETVWTNEQGLPQNSVTSMIQTRDGYLWLGTFGGLSRFDGIKFTTFNSGNTPGLKSNRILSLFEDRDGTLWLGTQAGEIMTFKNGIGKTYTTTDGLPGIYVLSFRQSADGTIWAGLDRGIVRFANGRFQYFPMAEAVSIGSVRNILNDENGQLLFVVDGGMLLRFDGQKLVIVDKLSLFDVSNFGKMANRKKGGVWIAAGEQIASFSQGQFSYLPLNDRMKGIDVRAIIEDREEKLWINYGSKNSLFYYQDDVFHHYPSEFGVRSLLEDREGNLWIGSDGKGLMRLRKRSLTTLTMDDGLPSNSIRAITSDGNGGVWIATGDGLAHWKEKILETYNKNNGLKANYINALFYDRNGGLWIGSPFQIYYLKDGKFSYFPSSGADVTAFLEDKDGNLWIGSEKGVNIRRDGKDIAVLQESNGLVNNDVHLLTKTQDGAIWIGTVGGLSRYKDGVFTNWTTEQGLSNNYVRDLLEDENGNLWLATYGGGLNLLRDGRITPITTKNGLFDDFLSRILPDGRGNFWFLSNRGIFKVQQTDLNDFVAGRTDLINSISFGVADGMKSSEGNGGIQPAGSKMPDGKLWFPTIQGVVVIDPAKSGNLLPPSAVIEQVLVNRTETTLGEKIEINPGQENIEIAYTGLSLTRSEQLKFKYQLEGLNDDWINAGTRRTANYSYIPPGEYTFKVMANNDGVWSQETTLKIVVYPPFYRTWWFILLCFLAVALLIYGLFRLRILQLKRQNAVQEEFSRRLINAHESERRRIAAELHDSIGQSLATIKNSAIFAVQTVKDLGEAKEQFEEITEESGNAIAEVREIAYNLRPHLLDRLGLTKAISSMLNRTADNLQMKMFLQIDDIDDLFENEAELSIYRIIQESLNNIIKHSEATEIRVMVERKEESVRIKIEDNGKGFKVNSPKQNGFGLLGISERVRMLGGTLSIKSEIDSGTITEIEIWTKQLKS
jgi:signal transduction histidine kinase/ligand-binding sensor domain-containing protein